MNKRTLILKDLKNQLTDYFGNDLINIYLFGSQAKNNGAQDSDYDILILLKTKKNRGTRDKVIDICYDIDLKHNILIDPHILSEEELTTIRGKQPIFTNAILNGISV
ncbi:MAG: nucleotidyltransferase domain-containing protein [Bacteroidia bacterium]|nr:nucleotidyltransferase domain-containing protein [Bacteroidia bacterium]